MKPGIVTTKDGSHTLYSAKLDEHYHSLFGAVTESMHIFIDAGLKAAGRDNLNILEMGFGTGLNAFLTLLEIQDTGKSVHYTGLEKFPLNTDILRSLNYSSLFPEKEGKLFYLLHDSPWNLSSVITDELTLKKIEIDICDFDNHDQYDLVYFDAFSPEKQPELWTTDIFLKVFRSMRSGSVLTTYSSKGQVRRNMAEAGFRVEKIPGPPGKRDMIRARKD